MKAAEVFTPGRFPKLTYVDDHLVDKKRQLLDALDAGSTLVSISGPSKSGKTVFVEQCLGKDNLIQVTGAGVTKPADLWSRVFDAIGTPMAVTTTSGSSTSGSLNVEGAVEGGVPLVAKAKGAISAAGSYTSTASQTEASTVDHLQLLTRELGRTNFIVFIDDFHYVPRDVQVDVARQIKEAIRQDVKILCASVPYHSDDVIRSNTDLRGRVSSIDFGYWKSDILEKIAYKGFEQLNIHYRRAMVSSLAAEAAGSPQLMQSLCLHSCYELGVRERPVDPIDFVDARDLRDNICRRTVASADYGSIVDKMKEGPKTRGSDRNVYQSAFGWKGDVYRLLVKALALDPPQLTFRYQALMDRIGWTCLSGGSAPSGSSIVSACLHAATIVNDAAGQKIVEWDAENDVFDITDPYLLFYLRWSDATDT